MTFNISRRKFIGSSAAGIALSSVIAGSEVLAQDEKPTVKVGSKDFTEQLVVGEIVSQLLENGGFPVERKLNLGGTLIAHEALTNGDIDTYVEYTGTGLIAILGMDLPERDEVGTAEPSATPTAGGGYAQKVYDIVAERYPEEFGVEWLDPWGFNNTYTLAMTSERAEELGVTKISDLVPLAGDLNIGTNAETLVREDGVPGLEKTYDMEFGDSTSLDTGLMYSAIDNGDVDVITAFATDGRIESLDLLVLEDDKQFFPPYFAAPVVRQELLEKAPDVRDILNSVAGLLDDARMTELNYLADGEGKEIENVARDFLVEEGLVDG